MNKELLEQALEAALSLLEYEHEEYTETRRKWGEGNPHRWERLKECTEKTNALVNSLRDAIEQDCAQRQAGQKRAAGAVMMSAHALCPTDMSHPRRMAWMAEHFLQNYTAPQPAPFDAHAEQIKRMQAVIERAVPADKPYAYEYGRSNGDGTYSIVIDRGELVQVAPRVYEHAAPSDPHKDRTVKPLYTAPQPAKVSDNWIEIRLPQDGQTIEGKSAIDAPAWIEDYDTREQLANMRFWRPAPDYPR